VVDRATYRTSFRKESGVVRATARRSALGGGWPFTISLPGAVTDPA